MKSLQLLVTVCLLQPIIAQLLTKKETREIQDIFDHAFNNRPIFNYRMAIQQDLKRNRYLMQQMADKQNLRKERMNFEKQNWSILDESFDQSSAGSELIPTNQTNATKRHDDQSANQIVYVTQQKPETELAVLNDLIGKNPTVQLAGLKQLLQSEQTVPVDTQTFEHLQNQLDEHTQQHAQRLLAEAQQQAQAHVQAQHDAIIKAQLEAQRAALAKIADHEKNAVGTPVALPLTAGLEYENPNVRLIPTAPIVQHQEVNQVTEVIPVQHQQPILEETHETEIPIHHQYASRYAFGYRVRDYEKGNDFGHQEERSGKNARGHYHVLLPDGRLQKVDYYVDPTGYHAKVTYENVVGTAHH